jgi:hypothetical protein
MMKVLVKSAWGSDDPTKGHFPSYMRTHWQMQVMQYKSFCWGKQFP